jgi:hypothetical protein
MSAQRPALWQPQRVRVGIVVVLLAAALAPALIRNGGLFAGRTLRIDLHPAALERPREMLALEWVLGRRSRRRVAVTYEDLLAPLNRSIPRRSTVPAA